MNTTNYPNAELSELASGLAHELARLVVQEHKLLQTELNQITELTFEAVRELSKITIQLKNSTEEIILSQPDADDKTAEDLRSDLLRLNENINRSTSETVRALQFGDILNQLTDHVLKRAISMDMLFTSLSNEVDMIKEYQQNSDESANMEDRVAGHISVMGDKVQSYKSLLPSSSPVKQKNLKMGKTELF